MRVTCSYCGKWVKDKFLFGTVHICLSPEERAAVDRNRAAQQRPQQFWSQQQRLVDEMTRAGLR